MFESIFSYRTRLVFVIAVSVAPNGFADFLTTDPTQTVLGQVTTTLNEPDAAGAHASADTLWYPRDVSVCGDAMFVADYYNSRILRYPKIAGEFSTTANLVLGQETLTSSDIRAPRPRGANTLSYPLGVQCDGTNLYVADGDNRRILIWKNINSLTNDKPADIYLGQPSPTAGDVGTGMDGMNRPYGLFVAGGKLFVADGQNHRILIWNSTSTLVSRKSADVVLGGTLGTAADRFDTPTGVFSDGTRLLVADYGNHRILYWTAVPTTNGQPANFVFGQPDMISNEPGPYTGYTFRSPYRVYYNHGQLIVSDSGHYRVLAYDVPDLSNPAAFWKPALNLPEVHPIGQASLITATVLPVSDRLHFPIGVISTSPGRYLIADYNNHRVVASNGDSFTRVWGQPTLSRNNANRGPRPEGLYRPGGFVSGKGKSFVVDTSNHRVLVFNSITPPNGAAADYVLGQPSLSDMVFDPESAPNARRLNFPTSASIDEKRLYVTDRYNNRVLWWDLDKPWVNDRPADGVIGQPDMNTRASSLGTLEEPYGVYSDGKRLYVAEHTHSRVLIWKIDAPGFGDVNYAVVLGQPSITSSGTGTQANRMNGPTGVFSDGLRVFVADFYNNRVLVWNDVETLSNGKSADRVLGQPNFGQRNECTDARSLACLSRPTSIAGDGQRLFVAHYAYVPDVIAWGRVLEWPSPIISNNEAPSKELWAGRGTSATSLIHNYIPGMNLTGKDLRITDMEANRVVKFTDPRSTYVDVAVTTVAVVGTAKQTEVVRSMEVEVGGATRGVVTRTAKWGYVAARQEGGAAGDIEEVYLCAIGASTETCGSSPLAVMTPVAGMAGLYQGTYGADVAAGTKYALMYRLSETAQVGQRVGLSLQVNSGFFGFKDGSDLAVAYVSNVNGPARTSGLTLVGDQPDVLEYVAGTGADVSIAAIPRETDVPFLTFQLKTNVDQVSWEILKLTKLGTVVDNTVGAAVWEDGPNGGWNGDEREIGRITRFTGGTAQVNVSATVGSSAKRMYVTLNANGTAVGTAGVKILASPVAFGVGVPDTVRTPYVGFESLIRPIVAHGPNTLMAQMTDLVVAGQTVSQGARVTLSKVKLWTDRDWTDLTEWTLTKKGTAGAADVAAMELWKDVNGNGVVDGGDVVAGTGAQVGTTNDYRFNLTGVQITGSTTTLLVTVRAGSTARAGVTVNAFMDSVNIVCDANTSVMPVTLSPLNDVRIVASMDVVLVTSFPEAATLSQGDGKRLVRKFQLRTNQNAATWQSLVVHQEGTADVVNDVRGVYLLKLVGLEKVTISTGVLDAGPRTWTLTFGDEVLTPTAGTYYLAVDIGDLATAGRTVVLNVKSTGSVGLDGLADMVSPGGFPHKSGPDTINQALSEMVVTGTNLSGEVLLKEVGSVGIEPAEYRVSVDKATVEWTKMAVLLSGTGAQVTDVAKVELYEGGVRFATGTVRAGTNYFDFVPAAGYRVVRGVDKTYTLRVDLSGTALPGDELRFTVVNANLTVTSPATARVGNSGGTFTTMTVKVTEPATALRVVGWTARAPVEVHQTDRTVVMATFTVKMSGYTGEWVKLRVSRGDGATFERADVTSVGLYRDVNGNGQWEATDALVGMGVFGANVNQPAELVFGSSEVVTTGERGYLLTVDVAGNAKEGNKLGLKLSAASSFVMVAPDYAVFPVGANYGTGLAEIKATVDALWVENTQDDVAPGSVAQGEANVMFLRLSMAARTNEVTLKGFEVVKEGTLPDASITDVRLWEDTNLDGTADKNWSVGTHNFSGGRVTLAFDGQDSELVPKGAGAGTITKRYFVAVTLSPLTVPGTTVKLKVDQVLVQTPDTVENAGSLGLENDDERVVLDRPDVVTPAVEEIPQLTIAGTVDQGAETAAVVLLKMRPNEDEAVWRSLKADLTLYPEAGNATHLLPDQFTRISLHKDTNGNGVLDGTEMGTAVAEGVRVGLSVTFDGFSELVTPGGAGYFVAVSLKEEAPEKEGFRLALRDPGATAIEPVDVLNWPGSVLESPLLKVRNVTAPTKPVVADYEDAGFAGQDFLGGTYTPPDVTGRGEYGASAIQVAFSWGSQMAAGRGGIVEGAYCFGTTAGACDSQGWTAFNPTPGVFMAKGLNLSHGTTYYVSVKAKSEWLKWSEVGVSNGILIDLAQPGRPVAGAPHIELTGYTLLWSAGTDTLSRVRGYVLEERRESSPAWKAVPAVRGGLDRPELTTDGLSLTFSNKPSGSYYYRVVAVNGVGTRSEGSNVVRVDFNLAAAPSFVSATSNYPNPFDATSGPTKITYTLKEDEDVQWRIYDGFGRLVREERFTAGAMGGRSGGNTVEWDGKDGEGQALPQGTYVIRLNAGGEDVRWKIGVWR